MDEPSGTPAISVDPPVPQAASAPQTQPTSPQTGQMPLPPQAGQPWPNQPWGSGQPYPPSAPPYPQQPYYVAPSYPQPYYVPVYTKPVRPGRGFGIASMVLGIIGAVYGFTAVMAAISLFSVRDSLQSIGYGLDFVYESAMSSAVLGVITECVFVGVLAILACVFSVVALKKGYKTGVSKSGLVLGIVSAGLLIAAAVVAVIAAA